MASGFKWRIAGSALGCDIGADHGVGRIKREMKVLKSIVKSGLLLAALGAPGLALAHAGHSGDGLHGGALYEGFVHPFTGIDHLLMMVFVGLWAGRSGGALRWQLPATFLAAMLGGWMLGAAGLAVPGLEGGIAATLIALGAIMALQLRITRFAQMGCVALFAVLHGLAHGSELGAGAWPGALGMLAATALLHLAGLVMAMAPTGARDTTYRGAGAALALAGGVLLAAG